MKKKRVILSAGGTGGHLFPAQSLASHLSDWEILFVAAGLSNCRYFNRQDFQYKEIESATFSFSQPLQVMKGGHRIYRGVKQSRRIIQSFDPHMVIGFGSFFTLPVLTAAALQKVPIVLHEQNAIPGKVNRLFSRFAHTTAITFPLARHQLKGNSVEVTFPLRQQPTVTRESCCEYFGLQSDRTTLLVFGGSQGAVSLNRMIGDVIDEFPYVQVLHFTGSEERNEEVRLLYKKKKIHACVKAFEPEINRAMSLADLAITRGGAGTIAELVEYELPALIIPYPFAADNHQERNGEYFVGSIKGGEMIREQELTPSILVSKLRHILNHHVLYQEAIQAHKLGRDMVGFDTLIKGIVT